MGHIDVLADREFDEPILVEGLPGVGLVGKIVADHLVDALDMAQYADVHCDALPPAAAYAAADRAVRTPVRLYAAPDRDLLVLQSDVPVSPDAAEEFADCVADWFREASVTPLYIAGQPDRDGGDGGTGDRGDGDGGDSDGGDGGRADDGDDDANAGGNGERNGDTGSPTLRGVAVGDGARLLDDVDVPAPDSAGLVSGPTGALLAHANRTGLDAVGLVVDADPRFPDPAAARVVLEEAVAPITGVDADLDTLEAKAARIREAKQRIAARMLEDDETVSQAQPLRMYQ